MIKEWLHMKGHHLAVNDPFLKINILVPQLELHFGNINSIPEYNLTIADRLSYKHHVSNISKYLSVCNTPILSHFPRLTREGAECNGFKKGWFMSTWVTVNTYMYIEVPALPAKSYTLNISIYFQKLYFACLSLPFHIINMFSDFLALSFMALTTIWSLKSRTF